MISKNKIKYIHSLELKKNRNKEGVFVAEGHKVVEDLLELQPAEILVATEEWLKGKRFGASTEVIEVTDEERNSELETIANTYNRDLEEIKQIFAQNMYQIDADILNRKALDVVKENLKK